MGAAYETDDALLLSGDPEHFGRFYDRYVESLLAFFQRRTRDPQELVAAGGALVLDRPRDARMVR